MRRNCTAPQLQCLEPTGVHRAIIKIDSELLAEYAKPMKVSAQYAEAHFPDVYHAAENGEEIVIARPGKPNLVLVPKPEPAPAKAPRIPRRELLGVWEGLLGSDRRRVASDQAGIRG
jgi:antitoxin (DNA-binding transcriptional repressor) of toxin-antitoxin stability system